MVLAMTLPLPLGFFMPIFIYGENRRLIYFFSQFTLSLLIVFVWIYVIYCLRMHAPILLKQTPSTCRCTWPIKCILILILILILIPMRCSAVLRLFLQNFLSARYWFLSLNGNSGRHNKCRCDIPRCCYWTAGGRRPGLHVSKRNRVWGDRQAHKSRGLCTGW